MANYLKYKYRARGADSSLTTFTDVNNAKSILDFSNWDFTGLTPEWTLEDTNTSLVVKIPFTDAQAHVEMKTFHNNVKDNWTIGTDSTVLADCHLGENEYVVNDIDIHSV